ncbi:MAG: hypothetical protein AAF514_06505 [Verrucomicrobiota bacterium]
MIHRRPIAWLATFFLALSVQAPAQNDEPDYREALNRKFAVASEAVEATLSVGLAGAIFNQAPTPVVLEVRNTSGETLEGHFEFSFFDGYSLEPRKNLRRPYKLGPNSRQRFFYSFNLHTNPNTQHLGARVTHKRDILWATLRNIGTERIDFGSHQTRKRLDLLVVDPRKRPFKMGPPPATNTTGDTNTPARPGERPIKSFIVDGPHLPIHPSAIFPFHGIVISPDMEFDRLHPSQMKCLHAYLINGGSVIFPDNQPEWLEKWTTLTSMPSRTPGETPLAVGTGQLHFMPAALMNAEPPARRFLYDAIDQRSEPRLIQDHFNFYNRTGSQASRSLLFLGLFFAAYTLVSGPLLLFFRKVKGRGFLRIIAILITVFCLLSILIGITLRFIPGDLHWMTITEPGPGGGATQRAFFSAGSAGRRSHALEINEGFWLQPFSKRFHQFSDRLVPPAETNLSLSIVPWTSRLLYSQTEVSEKIKPLQVEVRESTPRPNRKPRSNRNAKPATPPKTLTVEFTNPNDFEIRHLRLILTGFGDRRLSRGRYYNANNPNNRSMMTLAALGNIKPSQKRSRTESISWNEHYYSSISPHPYHSPQEKRQPRTMGQHQFIKHQKRGQMEGYLIGVIEKSPKIEISEGDFEYDEGNHYFFQKLSPDQLPDTATLLPEKP